MTSYSGTLVRETDEKNDHSHLFLKTDMGQSFRIAVEGYSPFDFDAIGKLEGQRVSVNGTVDKANDLVVKGASDVSVIPPSIPRCAC